MWSAAGHRDIAPPGPHLPEAPARGLSPAPGRPGSPRGAGSKVRHGHQPRSSRGQGEAGNRPAQAGPGVPGGLRGGDPGVEGAQVARLPARCWGLPPRRAALQGPASAALGCAKTTLSLWPPSFPPAGWQRRFPLGETTRILPGAPRPAPVPRPLPFAGEPVLARAREDALAACAGRWQGAGEPLATNSPRHVTRSSAQ